MSKLLFGVSATDAATFSAAAYRWRRWRLPQR